ncbi:MAG: metallophosphoesterase [Gammaproteobacteria bacterium]|nr:metallophosphoesterase [Gammaproteobacteria bacterium]
MSTLQKIADKTTAHLFSWPQRLFVVFLVLAMTISGCNNSGNETDGGEAQSELLISLTDAPGGFSSYTVDVLSLTLTTASGAVVETLPLNTRVDFAQYTDLSEFLTAATVPPARYVKATMRLDYQNADIWVANSTDEQPVKVTNITDIDGHPVGVLDVPVYLENRNALTIIRGVPAFLTLDFNLDASNQITFDQQGAPALVVEPFLIAELEPERPKVHRVRGPLFEVDASGDRFEIVIHPFHHRLPNNDHRFGKLPVAVDDNTIYDIDGQLFQGQAGLDALADLPAFTATIAEGDFNFRAHRFNATQVYAGSSVPGGTLDAVSGNVTQRNGDTLTVQGATLIRSDGSVVFHDSVTVEVSGDTVVRKWLSMDAHDIGDISVGQKVRVLGTLQDGAPGSPLVLDAASSDGRVFMGMTVLRGFAVETAGPMVVDVQSINFRNINLFDFAGTGIDAANDADPANYEVDTGTLNTGAIASGAPVAIGGFVAPFGQAPLDFTAQTVVDLSALTGVMVVNWDPASQTSFDSLTADGMILNLSGAGIFHHIGRAGVRIDLQEAGLPPTIQPVTGELGLFVIVQNTSATLFTNFELYTAALQTLINDGHTIKFVAALGHYDDSTVTMSAERMMTKIE